MVNQTSRTHGSHIQTISLCTHLHILCFFVLFLLLFSHCLLLTHAHMHQHIHMHKHTHLVSLCHSLTDSSRLSQVELLGGRGFAFVFFQYLLWTEDHGLTKGEKRSWFGCTGLTFVKGIHLLSSCSFFII